MNKSIYDHQTLLALVSDILRRGNASTQKEICQELAAQGFSINQSKISRLLHKLAAVKIKNPQGQNGYRLPNELAPPLSQAAPLQHLILKIAANENLVVIQTSPGSASLIARMLDSQNTKSEILATLAGDDTIFVAPKSVQKINTTLDEVKKLLSGMQSTG